MKQTPSVSTRPGVGEEGSRGGFFDDWEKVLAEMGLSFLPVSPAPAPTAQSQETREIFEEREKTRAAGWCVRCAPRPPDVGFAPTQRISAEDDF